MKQRFLALFIVFLLVFGLTTSAFAQSYSLELTEEIIHVYWNADGTMSLDYTFHFKNNPDAHAIEFVDVSLVNDNYSNISAEVDGHAVGIEKYEGDDSGIAVDLGSYAIPAGESGLVHVTIGSIKDVVTPDADDANYASAIFSTPWFGSQYMTGNTDLTVVFHLPPNIQADETRYHLPSSWTGEEEPEVSTDEAGRITYTWHDDNANGYTPYTFGASFPSSYLPAAAIVESTSTDSWFSISPIFYIPVAGVILSIGLIWFMQHRSSAKSDEENKR